MPDAKPPRKPFGYGKTEPKVEPPEFEVVEDEAADFEVVEDAPPKRPDRKSLDLQDEEPQQKPKKKKKRRSRPIVDRGDPDQDSRDAALRDYEWIFPSVLLGIGAIMTLAGMIGGVKSAEAGVGAFFYLLIGLFITIPITIVCLMGIGIVCGIEYGRLGPAILKIAAITLVANGIVFIAAWMKAPTFLAFPICCFITFGLFMTQFDLDTWETNVSVGSLNVLTFVSKFALIAVLIAFAGPKVDKQRTEPDDDPANEYQEKAKKRAKDRGDQLPGRPDPGPQNPDDDN